MWPEMTRVHARKAEEGFFAAETQLIFEGMQLMNALYTFEMFYAFSRFTYIENAHQFFFWQRPRVRLQWLSRQATFDSFQWRFRGRPQWKSIIRNFEYPYHFSVQKLEKSHFFDGTISKQRHYIDTRGFYGFFTVITITSTERRTLP